MVKKEVQEISNQAFKTYLYDIGMDTSKIKDLVPDSVKRTLYICQQRVKKVKLKVIAKELKISMAAVTYRSCDCRKYGYKV